MKKFYSSDKIRKENAQYNIIFGERSNGKTYDALHHGIEEYAKTGKQTAYIRRWSEDFKNKRAVTLCDGLVYNGEIMRLTEGKWSNVYYYSGRWYLCKYDEDNIRITDPKPFMYAFALTSSEHDKSTSYPDVTTIIYDEFLTRDGYLPDEFVTFMNVISTIIRFRTDVKIFMLGNTVNQYCPYFREMGIEEIKDMKQGTIRVYNYGDSGLKVAVEYCSSMKSEKDNNMYFAFDNPKLNMITSGVWELDLYPHCPVKYKPKDILLTYFIKFSNEVLQCEIIQVDDMLFTFIHRKTSDLQERPTDIIYSQDYNPKPLRFRSLLRGYNSTCLKIKRFFDDDMVYYQDNMVGETVRNYLQWCQQN